MIDFFEKSNTLVSRGSVSVSRATLAAADRFILGGSCRDWRGVADGHRVDGVRGLERADTQPVQIAPIGAVVKYLRAGTKALDRDTYPILHG
jgi:hypothetical protein